jgi:hypothetical protein
VSEFIDFNANKELFLDINLFLVELLGLISKIYIALYFEIKFTNIMKKILVVALLVLGTVAANAQETAKKAKTITSKVNGAGMVFANEVIDYGTITQNAEGKREFVFTNNGTSPLVITNAQGSCGCTVPSSPKEPIAPGAKGVIGVKYDTNRVGPFTKTVTISSNATGQPTKVLTIKGNVVAAAAKS